MKCLLTSQPRISRLNNIERLHQIPADLDLPVELSFRHLMYHVLGHLPVELAERVLGGEAQVVSAVHHVAVLVQEAFVPADIVRVYLFVFVC